MEEARIEILEAVLTLVGVLLSWAAMSARNWLKQRVQNEYVQQLMLRLSEAVEVGVRQVSQTLLPELRRAAEDGKITAEEAASLRQKAREAVFDQLTNVDQQKLRELFDTDQLNRKLDQLVESVVQKLKESENV
jgi:flagellar motility protein MotE (MotC chaperone)